MHTHVRMYMYVCVHQRLHVRTIMYTYMHVYVHACIRTCMYTYMHVYVHACIRTCMYTYMHVHCANYSGALSIVATLGGLLAQVEIDHQSGAVSAGYMFKCTIFVYRG